MRSLLKFLVLASFVLVPAATQAQTVVTLTTADTSQQSTLTATVTPQAKITVPSAIAFTVNNVNVSNASSALTFTAANIVLADAKSLVISVTANAANFTPPTNGTVTWAAADVSWNGPAWTGITGAGTSGTLASGGTYGTVATGDANVPTVSTAALVFTLGPKPTVDRSGAHTLVITWKIASS